MARRQHLARWAAGLCLTTAGTFPFVAQAGALEAQVGVQLPPLPVPVTLPSEVAVTLPVPDLGGQPAPAASTTASRPPARSSPAQTRSSAPTPTASPAPPAAPPSSAAPTPAAPLTDVSLRRPPGGPDGVVDTARRFKLPLGLTAALIGFLAVQALVDRRDPKLAAAPIEDEVLSFR